MAMVKRILGPDEVGKALEAGGPLAAMQADPAKLRDMSIAVVEIDGKVVAYWVVWYALHLEPLWVPDEYRRNPAVIGGIVDLVQSIVSATNEPAAFAVIEDGDQAAIVAKYADRLGFHEAPGKLYYIVVDRAVAQEG